MVVKSDHCPILLSLEPDERSEYVYGKGKPFRYELMWETNKGLNSLIKHVWKDGQICNSVKDVKDKLCHLGEELGSWGKKIFGAVRRQLRELKKKLEQLRSDPARNTISDKEQKVVQCIIMLNYQEEIMWKQRSLITWLCEGDSNTNFFHQRESRRRAKNRIVKLNRPDGSECTNVDELHGMAADFFRNLFKSEGTSNMHLVLDHVRCKMFPTKSPGPNGFPAHFFQHNWDICGDDLTRMVLRVLNENETPAEINEGFSSVIKGERAEGVVEGIQISSTAPKINHLLFADDSLLFCKAAASNARVVQESLVKYCEASGQKVNLAKSSIFFSKGCKQTIRDEIKAITHVENESLKERYLGLPTDVGRTTNGAFKYLKDRVWNKV